MAFETRGSGQYYYRSRRVNGHVRKIYVGTGPRAQQIYEYDQQRQEEKSREQAIRQRIHDLDTNTKTLVQMTDTLIKAHLLINGYHQHNRSEWRKRRQHN